MNDVVRAFGVWDAPLTDVAEWIEVPLELSCMHCVERFRAGENGAVFPTGYAAHRECHLRAVMGGIGHHVDHAHYCRSALGPDAGLTRRQSSLLVWSVLVDRKTVTRDDLERLRAQTAA
jgi:hypothetical protein